MRGPTCIFWANLTPCPLQDAWLACAQVAEMFRLLDGDGLPGALYTKVWMRKLELERGALGMLYGPGPPGCLSALSVFLYKSVFYGAFVWARRALNSRKRRFPARAKSMDGKLVVAPTSLPGSFPRFAEWCHKVGWGKTQTPGVVT